MSLHKFILLIAPRIAYFFYWIFDTFIVLAKIKVLPNLDQAWLTFRWAAFWTFANLVNILAAVVELVEIGKDEAKLFAQRKVQNYGGNEEDIKSLNLIRQQENDIKKRKFEQILNIVKNAGDAVTSTQILGWPKKFLGYEFNDGMVGLGGLTSALITCY